MQTKKKKLIYRTIGVLLALSFMSCCFLGYTFARYVTKGTGNIISGVAKWDINFSYEGGDQTVTGDETISIGKISPSMAEYSAESAPRSKQIAEISVNIKNDGDVAAYISFELPDDAAVAYPYEKDEDGTITETISATEHEFIDNPTDPNEPTAAEWAQIFTASIVQSTEGEDGTQTGGVTITSSDGSVSTVTPEGEADYKGMYFVETGETLTVPIVITWTTDLKVVGQDGQLSQPEPAEPVDDYPADMNVVPADLRDSWIGTNIAAIGLTFNWYALQGSEQPGP